MNARTGSSGPTGFVTVAQAAAELTRRGDKIDASNVSRYLARNPDIPSRREGRCRFVDLAELILHRSGNSQSASRRDALAPVAVGVDDEDGSVGLPVGIASEIQQANLRIKQLEVRKREREDALDVGALVPADQVLTVVNTAMAALVSELERQEVEIAARFGRDISAAFRRARKDAQQKASEKLALAAKAAMHANVAEQLMAPESLSD